MSDDRRTAFAEGEAILYRLFDVGYEIHLDAVADLLAPITTERAGPGRGEAQAIQIANPPVTARLGSEHIEVGGVRHQADVSARIFDFGVVSLRISIPCPGPTWPSFVALGCRLESIAGMPAFFGVQLEKLLGRIGAAIERPGVASVTEDYTVFRLPRVLGDDGSELSLATLRDDELVQLLLGERRTLSPATRQELLPHRFSYGLDDLVIPTWTSALIVEPVSEDTDIQYVLEFANAQLLELRVYDALLDAELPRMYDRITRSRSRPTLLWRRFGPLLQDLQMLVADSTEIVERAENSLKVTDDVYLSRVYASAIDIFRGRAWRRSIDRKLTIIRETYEMLNAESLALRGETMELVIVLLITVELVLGIVRR
jgi:hypothetical protein